MTDASFMNKCERLNYLFEHRLCRLFAEASWLLNIHDPFLKRASGHTLHHDAEMSGILEYVIHLYYTRMRLFTQHEQQLNLLSDI